MEDTSLLSIIGIVIIFIGGFTTIKSALNQSNSELFSNTAMSFGNPIEFKSNLFNKYNQLFGFSLMAIGSLIQLYSYFMVSLYVIVLNQYLLLFIIIVSGFLVILITRKLVNFIVSRKYDYEMITAQIRNLEDCISNIGGKKKWFTEEYCNNYTLKIIEILNRRFKNFNETETVEIIAYAKKQFKIS